MRLAGVSAVLDVELVATRGVSQRLGTRDVERRLWAGGCGFRR